MNHTSKLIALVSLASIGCASRPADPASAAEAKNSSAPSACDMRQDQRAILAMAGSYDVEFDFEETDVLTEGYQKHEPHKSYATELVIVIDDAPGRASLQHILQMGEGPSATIIKHWRQDWVFEDQELLEFRGRDVWERRRLTPAEARCTWTQAVFGVEDAPRYDGYGRWTHSTGGSVWESNETWRPLPRREYTTRNDYDVLVAVNRHRITKDGWEHEQNNSKLVLEPRHSLVREHGVNRYTHAKLADTQEALKYWRTTGAFWGQVREEWQRVFASTPRLNLQSEASGKRLYEALFARAGTHPTVDAATVAFIRETLHEYVVEPSRAATAAAASPSALGSAPSR